MSEITRRPGRRIAAAKRRLAKEILQEYLNRGDFYSRPTVVQEAILLTTPALKAHRISFFKEMKEAYNAVC